MEGYIRELCKFYGWSFDEMIQQYNSNTMTESYFMNHIINHKIENNKDIIYKEDIPKIFSKIYKKDISQEEFMEKVISNIKSHNIDINNLGMQYCYTHCMFFYYIITFLEHEPVDIKIALKRLD
jgi:hypothetical protein